MKKIVYALCGEGRGHASRAICIGNLLEQMGYDVLFLTSSDGYSFLKEKFSADKVVYMPTPSFFYNKKNKISHIKTIIKNMKFIFNRRFLAKPFIKIVKDFEADICMSDFEPLMSFIAKKIKRPFIFVGTTIYCSHFFSFKKYLDREERWYLFLISLVTRLYMGSKYKGVIVSNYYNLISKNKKVFSVNSLLREEILSLKWKPKDKHILVYLRSYTQSILPKIVKVAKKNNLKVIVYNLMKDYEIEGIENKSISPEFFIQDLASSNLVISSAGTQMINEVSFLGVPTLLIPETNQFEQGINSILASEIYSNIISISLENFTTKVIKEALNNIKDFKSKKNKYNVLNNFENSFNQILK